jgi:hypothetical protein
MKDYNVKLELPKKIIMKNLLAIILMSFALIQGSFGQSEQVLVAPTNEQLIAFFDKKVMDIKNNLNNYRKIKSEADSLMEATNTNNNFTETAFKNGKELMLVQYVDLYGHMKSADYYFNNGQLMFIEIKNRDNSYEKSYFNGYKMIAWNRNGKEVDKSSEDFKLVENATIPAVNKLIKRYKNK